MGIIKIPEIVDDTELEATYKLIGQNIKRLRKERNISPLDMALSIGQKAVSFHVNAENVANNKKFNLEHLIKIARVLDVDICELFRKIDDREC